MDQDREARIRVRAYDIWEREGRQENSHEAHWQQAEKELLAEEVGEAQQVGNGAVTAPPAGSSSAEQPSESAPSAAPGTASGSTADAPARAPRSKSRAKGEGTTTGLAG